MSLGYGPDGKRARKVSGRTETEVRDKLKDLHTDLDTGVRLVRGYMLEQAVTDWLAVGLPGRTAKTIEVNRDSLKPVLASIGRKPLQDLTAQDVRAALTALVMQGSQRTLGLGGMVQHSTDNAQRARSARATADREQARQRGQGKGNGKKRERLTWKSTAARAPEATPRTPSAGWPGGQLGER